METPKKLAWLKVGVAVDYHSVIDGPVTKSRLTVREAPFKIEGPRGCRAAPTWCVMLNGKSGWVACEALTPAAPGPERSKP